MAVSGSGGECCAPVLAFASGTGIAADGAASCPKPSSTANKAASRSFCLAGESDAALDEAGPVVDEGIGGAAGGDSVAAKTGADCGAVALVLSPKCCV